MMPDASFKEVFLQFARYVLNDNNNYNNNGFPAYNFFHQYFVEQMQKFQIPQPALVSWLTPAESKKAIQDFADYPELDISLMTEPIVLVNDICYPQVNIYHFYQQYRTGDSFGKLFDKTKSFNRIDSFGRRA